MPLPPMVRAFHAQANPLAIPFAADVAPDRQLTHPVSVEADSSEADLQHRKRKADSLRRAKAIGSLRDGPYNTRAHARACRPPPKPEA